MTTPLAEMSHPHFNRVTTPAHPNVYESKASGLTVRLEARGKEFVAVPAMNGGEALPIHAEPLAWADDPWDVLDAIHALR